MELGKSVKHPINNILRVSIYYSLDKTLNEGNMCDLIIGTVYDSIRIQTYNSLVRWR